MDPFVPLGIASCVRLLVLGLEDAHDLALRIPGKIAAGTPLCNHSRMRALKDGLPDTAHDLFELRLGHDILRRSQTFRRNGSDTLGSLEY